MYDEATVHVRALDGNELEERQGEFARRQSRYSPDPAMIASNHDSINRLVKDWTAAGAGAGAGAGEEASKKSGGARNKDEL